MTALELARRSKIERSWADVRSPLANSSTDERRRWRRAHSTIHFEQMSYHAGMVLWDEVGANLSVDGDVRYRVTEHGTRVGILPACA